MSDKETLEKAIRRAISNGWTPPLEDNIVSWHVSQDDQDTEDTRVYVMSPYVTFEMEGDIDWQQDCLMLIYNHQFARALWGDEWQYHLQNMVISDNPIQYLGANI